MKLSAEASAEDALWALPASAIAGLIARREISAREVCEVVLARIEALDPVLHAFATTTPDLALNAAGAVDRALAARAPLGPLAGVPFSVKDLILTDGVRTAMGSPLYRDFVPTQDDIAVDRMKAAGALMIGKTVTSEFGYTASGRNPLGPAVLNPWNDAVTPGGSSAGAAVAVATGMAPVALGSDGGGSIRIPASCCGVVGFKPSMGRVPLYPGCRNERLPGSSSFESVEHIGPLSRTVADAVLMFDAIAGPDPRDRHSRPREVSSWHELIRGDVRSLRIAYTPNWGYAAIDHRVRGLLDTAVLAFSEDLGCTVEEAAPDFADPSPHLPALEALETDLSGLRDLARGRHNELSPALVAVIERDWIAEEFTNAITMRKALCNRMAAFMETFDLIITPTLAVPPFAASIDDPEEIDGREVKPGDWAPFPIIANLTGQPAISLPAGLTSDGLPVGLQIIGRHLDDATVLRAASAFEAVRPWRHLWPDARGRHAAPSRSGEILAGAPS